MRLKNAVLAVLAVLLMSAGAEAGIFRSGDKRLPEAKHVWDRYKYKDTREGMGVHKGGKSADPSWGHDRAPLKRDTSHPVRHENRLP